MTGQLFAVGQSTAALKRIGPRTLRWLMIYGGLLGLVFGGSAWALVTYQGAIGDAILDFFLPESWHTAGRFLVERFWASQAKSVLISLTLGAALMVSSLLLFPVKEHLGLAFEREAGLTGRTPREFPLWYQAWEEIKLFLLYTALSFLIIRLGHTPDPTRRAWAQALSYATLAFTFSVDFIAPLMQRHRLRYSQILKAMLKRPLILLIFGGALALPPALIGAQLASLSDWPLAEILALGLLLNLASLLLAVLLGNALGAQLLPAAEATPVSHPITRGLVSAAVLAALIVNGFIFGQVGYAAYGVSPLLKCDYALVPSSFDADIEGILSPTLFIKATISVRNPTDRDVSLKDAKIELRHSGDLLTTTALPTLSVPAGAIRTQPIALEVAMGGGVMSKGISLFQETAGSNSFGDAVGVLAEAGAAAIDPERYALTLLIPTSMEDFPVFLYAGERSQ